MMDPLLYYGLSQEPFTKQTRLPHPFETEDYKEIQARMNFLKDSKGIGVFTGNSGMGKTSAVREFSLKLNPALYKVVYIPMTSVSVNEFLRQLAVGLDLEPSFKKSDLYRQIQTEIRYLMTEKRCTPVFLIDEAQFLPAGVFRDLVMLLNFDMDSKDYCILVLMGSDMLNGLLRRPANEALRQRITVRYHMEGFTKKEASEYISYVMEECSAPEPVFSENAIEAAYRYSQGSLRKLNSILSKSLLDGAVKGIRLIDENGIERARQELEI